MSRPFDLDALFRALPALPGIGPKNGKLIEKLVGGPKILDLLFHLPVDFIDRRFSPTVEDAPDGRIATMEVTVVSHAPNPRKGLPYRVKVRDESGVMTLVFFHANKGWVEKQLPDRETRIISGKVEYYQGNAKMVHPDIATLEERSTLETVEPIYPLTAGVTNKTIRKSMGGALTSLKPLDEWLEPTFKTKNQWSDWHDAMRRVHEPEEEASLLPEDKERSRIAYDELLANQLTLALVRHRQRRIDGRSYQGDGHLRSRLLEALPFDLTQAQQKTLKEIDADMTEDAKMLRLLQGDVGAGKTVVAAMAMLNAVETGAQAAIMAPTEILARQHEETLSEWLDACGVSYATLTGRDKGAQRSAILERIESGDAQIIIGTHAIFQDTVQFKDLGLVVIDEQHRFGVHQRLLLSSKGHGTDVLVMTATPIPRTLTLTAYGDMDVSRLDEKPPGRKPIETLLVSNDRLDTMIDGLERKIKDGSRVYWVCPLVEESEILDLAAAEERYDILKQNFGKVGLVHGRMKPVEKDEVMQRFASGELNILVATTVIEVGVNVPEATIMVIEHAERFGLSQLHQLRGRVGRGDAQSYCFLIYAGPLGSTAKERLSIMRETEDGFLIAERDLELRGGGDILGVKQSGLPQFRLADLNIHGELLAAARDDAKLIIERDPHLEQERGNALKTLLYLFERDQAIQYLRSG
ncbi:MAG: ATP-dependent DNA helicase RecG [Bdellovibrionales bacterium]